MREDMKRSFRGKIVINIAIGAVISLVVSFVLIYYMGAISDALLWIGGKDGLINPSNVQKLAMWLITAEANTLHYSLDFYYIACLSHLVLERNAKMRVLQPKLI